MIHLTAAEGASLAASVLIPLLSAVLYRQRSAHRGMLFGLLTLALSAVNGFLTEWAAAGTSHFDWQDGVWRAALAYGLAVAAHYGYVKDTPTEARLIAAGSPKGKTRVRSAAGHG
jgi:hypothetical protein